MDIPVSRLGTVSASSSVVLVAPAAVTRRCLPWHSCIGPQPFQRVPAVQPALAAALLTAIAGTRRHMRQRLNLFRLVACSATATKNVEFPSVGRRDRNERWDEEEEEEKYSLKRDRVVESKEKKVQTVSAEIKNISEPVRSFYMSQCPEASHNKPEVALFGRSNVGKSSLINFLCERKLLSTISKNPGHTKLIHHFLIDNMWYLVDLPGIGHADVEKSTLKDMNRMVNEYVEQRTSLVRLLYLVDAGVHPQKIDLKSINFLRKANVPMWIVFTKTDKEPEDKVQRKMDKEGPVAGLSKALLAMKDSEFSREGGAELPRMFLTSSKYKTGREMLLEALADERRRHALRLSPEQEYRRQANFRRRPRPKNLGPPPAVR